MRSCTRDKCMRRLTLVEDHVVILVFAGNPCDLLTRRQITRDESAQRHQIRFSITPSQEMF